jgi:hypothetical protein
MSRGRYVWKNTSTTCRATRSDFTIGDIVYDLQGNPVGQLRNTHVYSIHGEYVGELDGGMILDKNRSLGNIGTRGVGSRGGRAVGSRGARACAYSDVSHKLFR